MNGIGLLVLISLFGQVGAAPGLADSEKDYGWQINPVDNVLEYIIQLSPETISVMQSTQQEKTSDMPPELVGRATRTVVRIGKEVLPRTPSLAAIAKMPRFGNASDLHAQIDPGRFSEVESLKNVQQSGLPPLPGSAGSSTPLSDAGNNLIDRARAAWPEPPVAASPAANAFLNDARNLANAAGNSGISSSANPSRIQNTAPPPLNSSVPPSTSNAATGVPQPSVPLDGWADPRTADTRGGLLGYQNPPYAAPSDPVSLDRPGLGFASTPSGQMPGQTLAEQMRQRQLASNNPYSSAAPNEQASYEQLYFEKYGYLPTPARGGGFTQNAAFPTTQARDTVTHIASNPSAGLLQGDDTSASDGNAGAGKGKGKSDTSTSASEADSYLLLQVFFVLSLVVNVYLGTLIRKLLTRYRSLLSNVRSQTA